MTALNISELTTADPASGTGAFDVLMRSVKAQLDNQFTLGRIKGAEYATVYLGSLQLAMQSGLSFVLEQRKNDLEAQILTQQVLLAQAEVTKANAMVDQINAQVALTEQQTANALAELAIITANALKVPAEVDLIEAQTAQTTQETLNKVAQKLHIDAQAAQSTAQTALVAQQTLNAVTEGLVLTAQKCKLDAEFDLLQTTNLKTIEEKLLLAQKTLTERAQVTTLGVDADSILGRQKGLYLAQTNGFSRDAEQKAAKVMVDTWNVRRTTDEGTVADGVNLLNDVSVGRAVNKLLTGVGA